MPLRSRWTAARQAGRPTAGTEPPPPPPDYLVTGTLNPNVSGQYFFWTSFGGKPAYLKLPPVGFLWYNSLISRYTISLAPGFSTWCWIRTAPGILGDYAPTAGYTGTATVSTP